MSELNNKIALVTGGARGIGRSICLELSKKGAHVLVNFSSSSDAAKETVRLCEGVSGKAEIFGFDVSDSKAVEEAFASIKQKFGKLDILVNNAGVAVDGLILRMKDEDWRKTLGINLDGAFFCSRSAAKLMLKVEAGRIINISSVVGEMGNAGQAAYVSSKAGLIGLTKALARELASRSITVNAVTPGFIETDMTAALSEEVRSEHFKHIPLARYGKADEVAKLVSFLAGPDAAYITGQVMGINGGMYM